MSTRAVRQVLSRRDWLGTMLAGVGAHVLGGCSTDQAPTNASVGAPARGRQVEQALAAVPTRDGAGVRLSRSIGSRALPLLDPFLLLDEIRTDAPDDYLRGFPNHPHRGFETVTYMIHGSMEHADSVGNRGRLVSGSAQWMTAGRGIVHSEMPKQDRGLLWGFQLWVNLPSRSKMMKPRYQDIPPDAIPEVALGQARARVVAGTLGGQTGPVSGIEVEPTMLDLTLDGPRIELELPTGHAAFAYVLEGDAQIGATSTPVGQGHIAVLGEGTGVTLAGRARMLLLAGRPIGEPVARRGPFVMNTEAELDQAVLDYRTGRLVEG
jgi:redox-sensitive bicupin YhaK (pirin superfamily)